MISDRDQTLANETAIERLLGRWVKRRRTVKAPFSTPHATDTNPNREFAQTEPVAVWFFVFLPIFMLLYAIVEKMHVR
ncbi:hypothetical protein [Bradyrhizobium sp. 76]|uniref:hypothetical protein n=1 Tax=Bradyrhizobium sp. 76 TaxID=2782680 RepID=UPI001FF7615B|nr:hypothetical protein [Bradyrhizobium sp. 76]